MSADLVGVVVEVAVEVVVEVAVAVVEGEDVGVEGAAEAGVTKIGCKVDLRVSALSDYCCIRIMYWILNKLVKVFVAIRFFVS